MGDIKGIKDGTRGCDFNNRFNFEAIGAQTTADLIGIEPFLEDCAYVYENSKEIMNFSYNASDNIIDLKNFENDTYNGNLSIVYTVDELGVIVNSTRYNISYTSSASYQDKFTSYDYPKNFTCIKNPKISSCELEPEENCIYGGRCAITPQECEVNPATYACSENTNDSLNCTQHRRNDQDSSFISGGGPNGNLWASSNCNYSFINELLGVKDWDFFFDLAKESVDVKINILKNNDPQNCDGDICGSEPEDCWNFWAYTTVADTGAGAGAINATSQKWKTRLRKTNLEDEELQKYIVTVESKYYLQIPIEDSDPIRILVDSGTDTFSGNQKRGTIHEFTNEDFQAQIGQPIYGCLNIKRIDRL